MSEKGFGYILALYDFRSKQEYIYRTNKIKEITGASALLSDAYKCFAEEVKIEYDLTTEFSYKHFEEKVSSDTGFKGMVIYDGGGNLMVLFKDKDAYIEANHTLSRIVREKLFTAGIIVSCVDYTGNFAEDRAELYKRNRIKKNTGNVTLPYSVFPFTQIDRETLMPVVIKDKYKQESLTSESLLKQAKFEELHKKEKSRSKSHLYLDNIVTEKGRESLLAIIYIDGNAMGDRLKAATENRTGYDECIKALREFSNNTNTSFVNEPINEIEKILNSWQEKHPEKKHMGRYRRVIAGGDEITIICNARLAKDIVKTYFEKLDSKNSGNYACAGIALFHSHAPFADMYEIAEQCCESGKKKSRAYTGSKANFIDFHFCRSAVTNDMETIREKQEKSFTKRPYELSEFIEFCDFAEKLSIIGRSNIKELANALICGESYYLAEVGRIRSRYPETAELFEKTDADKLIFDVAQVYDLWFSKESEKTEGGAEE